MGLGVGEAREKSTTVEVGSERRKTDSASAVAHPSCRYILSGGKAVQRSKSCFPVKLQKSDITATLLGGYPYENRFDSDT